MGKMTKQRHKTARNRFLKGGAALAASALFMRTVSVSFNAYTVSRVGAEGMGLFTLTMSLYGFFLTLATSGVGLAVTRLVADALGRSDGTYAGGMLRRCLSYALICSGTASLVLFFGSPMLAKAFLHDMRTLPSLRLLALGLVPISLSSVFSGYFVAVRRTTRNAVVSIAEQWIKIVLTVFLLGRMMPYGVTWACVALVLGGMLGELLSCLVLAITWKFDRIKHPISQGNDRKQASFKPLLEIAVPIAGGAYARSALVTVEHMLIPIALASYGAGRDAALASYGALHSMAIPIVLYPMALLSSFAGLLVPEYTESMVLGNEKRLKRMTSEAFSGTFSFSVGVAAVLFMFGNQLGVCLYGSQEAGNFIRALAWLIPVMYLDHVTDAMLKGIGMQVYAMVVNIADSLFSIMLVVMMLPKFGAMGYVWVITLAEILNFSLSYIGLYRRLHMGISPLSLLRPLPSLAFAVVCTLLLTKDSAKNGFSLGLQISIFAVIYMTSLALTGQNTDVLSKKDKNEGGTCQKTVDNAFEKRYNIHIKFP